MQLDLHQPCSGYFGGFSTEFMIISLSRFSQINSQEPFALLSSTGWFDIQTAILSALDPRESRRFLLSCLALYCERTDLLLSATQLRLQLDLSAFTVPTPPVQVFLQPAVGQGGGFWDEVESSDSQSLAGLASEEVSNAVENQNPNGV